MNEVANGLLMDVAFSGRVGDSQSVQADPPAPPELAKMKLEGLAVSLEGALASFGAP